VESNHDASYPETNATRDPPSGGFASQIPRMSEVSVGHARGLTGPRRAFRESR